MPLSVAIGLIFLVVFAGVCFYLEWFYRQVEKNPEPGLSWLIYGAGAVALVLAGMMLTHVRALYDVARLGVFALGMLYLPMWLLGSVFALLGASADEGINAEQGNLLLGITAPLAAIACAALPFTTASADRWLSRPASPAEALTPQDLLARMNASVAPTESAAPPAASDD